MRSVVQGYCVHIRGGEAKGETVFLDLILRLIFPSAELAANMLKVTPNIVIHVAS